MANIRAAKEETPAGAASLDFCSCRAGSRPARVPCSAKHRPNLLRLDNWCDDQLRDPHPRSTDQSDWPKLTSSTLISPL